MAEISVLQLLRLMSNFVAQFYVSSNVCNETVAFEVTGDISNLNFYSRRFRFFQDVGAPTFVMGRQGR